MITQLEAEPERILVSAPTKAGEQFIRLLQSKQLPFAALTNNEDEKKRLEEMEVGCIIVLDTRDSQAPMIPAFPIGKAFLFERSLPLCCRCLQICRPWTARTIYVVTLGGNARLIYKGIGADYVIHSRSEDFSFLLG